MAQQTLSKLFAAKASSKPIHEIDPNAIKHTAVPQNLIPWVEK